MSTTTEDTPDRLALMPDWREGVRLSQVFQSTVQTSGTGLEQSSRRRNRPVYYLEYTRTGLTSEEAHERLEAIRTEFRKPLIVPLWCDGIPLQDAMSSATVALLSVNPVTDEWRVPLDVYLWTPDLGGEWRTCSLVDGRNLTLSGTGTLYPAGALCFPSRVMVREAGDALVKLVDVRSGTEDHRYRTL